MTRSLERGTGHRQLTVGDQLHQELRVVDHLVVPVELGVFVLERVETVRTLRDDLLHAETVERLDVLHGEHLEDVLVARAAGAVARAHLGRAEDREVDAGALEQLGHGPARLLVAVVERTRAADPVEVLVVEVATGLDDLDALERVGPVAALALVHPVDVPAVLHGAVHVAEGGREVALHEGEVPTHVEDLVEDLDVDRADLVARLARGAGPQLLSGDALEEAVGRDRDLLVDADGRRHGRRPGERP